MTVKFYTLGCKLNQAETEALARDFLSAGFCISRDPNDSHEPRDRHDHVDFGDPGDLGDDFTGASPEPLPDPDVVIVNSCTVTSRSDQKVRRQVRFFAKKHPRALVVLAGCYAQVEYESLKALFGSYEGVRIVRQTDKHLLSVFAAAAARESGFSDLKPATKAALLDGVISDKTGRLAPEEGRAQGPFALSAGYSLFHARAFLKIQDGCDNRCAYCRVPLARGDSVSLPSAPVLDRIREIVDRGFAEIVFTGVNISSYRDNGRDLAALLESAVAATRNVRFRLSSLEPDSLSETLFGVLRDPAICPHFHLPVQSGSDRVLSLMRRRYGAAKVRENAARLLSIRPDAFVSADIIVGFPGENDDDFQATLRLVREARFTALHVFPFSARPGTAAWSFKNRVDEALVKKRVRELVALSGDLRRSFVSALAGKEADVILETPVAAGAFRGSTGHSVKCLVTGIPAESAQKKRRVCAAITSFTGDTLCAAFVRTWEGSPLFTDSKTPPQPGGS